MVISTVIQYSESSILPTFIFKCMCMIFMETVDSSFIYSIFTRLLLTTVTVAFTMTGDDY